MGQPFQNWRNEIALAAAETLYTDWTRTGIDALTVSLPRRGRNLSNELVPSRGDGRRTPHLRLRAGVRSSTKFSAIKHCAEYFGP